MPRDSRVRHRLHSRNNLPFAGLDLILTSPSPSLCDSHLAPLTFHLLAQYASDRIKAILLEKDLHTHIRRGRDLHTHVTRERLAHPH